MWATQSGFKAIYLSGGGVAAGSLGLPDLGISSLDEVQAIFKTTAAHIHVVNLIFSAQTSAPASNYRLTTSNSEFKPP